MVEKDEIINPSPQPQDEFAEYRHGIRSFSRFVNKYGLATPAIIMLEAHRPLNWILAQGLHIVNPSISVITEFMGVASHEDLEKFARFSEDRRAFSVLIEEIERQESQKKKLRNTEKGKAKRKSNIPQEEPR